MSPRVKSCLFSAVAAAVAVAGVLGVNSATAQQEAKKESSRVGLIDMAEVFKKYDKFNALREDLKQSMLDMDAKAKPQMEELNQLRQKIQTNAFAEGSPQREQAESRLFELSSDLEALRKKAQVDVMRKESEIYKDVYLEVQSTVAKFSQAFKYDVVFRFNSNRLEETNNPQAVLQQMNRQVVHHNPSDDITGPIVRFLNDKYKQAGGNK